MFPYHYGSHATHEDHTVFMSVNKFPYHYGSHATGINEATVSVFVKFPYHYGSHATWSCGNSKKVLLSVSIPLWFSRNVDTSGGVDTSGSFHTTMVLTQRRYWYAKYVFDLVSIPLWFSRNYNGTAQRTPQQRVSIPLWFSRNRH